MTNASIDQNGVRALIGALDSDGVTIVPIKANTSTHRLKLNNGSSGANNGPASAPRDGNFTTVVMGVSSSDGVTPVVVYADSSGNLLVNSN